MSEIASTPEPPYVAVIFTSVRTEGDDDGYAAMASRMEELGRGSPATSASSRCGRDPNAARASP